METAPSNCRESPLPEDPMKLRRSIARRLALAWFCLASLAGAAERSVAQGVRPARALPPEEYSLTTKDGVQLRITYYPSSAGPQAVPVVLLHDFNETRAVLQPLAAMLNNPPPELAESLPPGPLPTPMAAVTVDLRGHGDSKTAFEGDSSFELDANRFGVADFQDMVLFDMEAVRSFLVERNDAGELNLNKLCVVGAGMGANVALTFAARDWAIPPLAARKQGQDVKALVLISPRKTFRGLSSVEPLKFPPVQQELSIYLAYGARDPKVAKDGENIQKIFARYHAEPPAEFAATRKDYFAYALPTSMQGSELVTAPEFGQAPRIAAFIEMRLGRRDFPHVVRIKR
jgi:pimeloyl-ACP methyl ester carboxylesterase